MEFIELNRKNHLKTISRFWLGLLRRYFRIEVEGIENIPHSGPAILLPNHSGFAGADAVLLTYIVKRETRRRSRILAHRAYFDYSRALRELSESFGLRKASVADGVKILKRGNLLIVFPEGESGNFKASYKRYRLERFHTGFVRMALETRAPVVPCVILGAEESHLNLGNLDFSEFVRGLRIPLPLNFLPLPAKWKIVFLPPVTLEAGDPEEQAREFQARLQAAIDAERKTRPYIYFRKTRQLSNALRRGVFPGPVARNRINLTPWKKRSKASGTR